MQAIRIRKCLQLSQVKLVRSFSSCQVRASGHNRWSKIKHDKAKVDATVNKQRAALAYEICLASKENGPDPQFNPRLATIIVAAKKQGYPKPSIEAAIARGQGISPSGQPLTSLTLEAMIPPSVGVIIECQTDSKLRTLADLKYIIKEFGGSVSPASHLFERKGKVVLENSRALTEDDIFDTAIEAGATDIKVDENEDGNGTVFVVYTEPQQTAAAAKDLSQVLELKVLRSEITWVPKDETVVDLADDTDNLKSFLDRLHENTSVQDVHVNAN